MISFFFKNIFSIFVLFTTYSLFKKKEIKILEILILLFLFHLCVISFLLNIDLLTLLLSSVLIVLVYYLYKFLERKELNKKDSKGKVLINRGIINFHELIETGYSYESFMFELKKKGIKDPDCVDYCIKQKDELIVFQKNSIRNYPISLIIDGKILKDNLFSLKKTMEWLEKKLEENNLTMGNINYAYYKNKEVYFITNE